MCPVCGIGRSEKTLVANRLVEEIVDVCAGKHFELPQTEKQADNPEELTRSILPVVVCATQSHIPRPVYHLMTDKQIKNFLKDKGLVCTGTRKECIERCNHFVNLFNANCDAKQPKSHQQIVHEANSAQQSTAAPITAFFNGPAKNTDEAHAKRYCREFDALVADVQRRRAQKTPKP